MENEKREIRISLSNVLLIIAIIVIIIMICLIIKLNYEAKIETQEIIDLNNKISSLQNTINSLNEKTSEDKTTLITSTSDENNYNLNDNISDEHIEMTEEKYKEYSTKPYSFRIQEMIDNGTGTITIKGRVYKEADLLSITKEQYDDLVSGKTINLLGYQMKQNKDEDLNNGGYDMLISSTGEKWMKFYVKKNSDGTGKLQWYTERDGYNGTPFQEGETGRFIGTKTYMQITLDENLKCMWGNKSKTLRNEYEDRKQNQTLVLKDEDDVSLPLLNDEFIFENGVCESILFSNV